MATSEGNAEKRCIKELFNILNDSVDHLYPDIVGKIPTILDRYKLMEKQEAESRA